MKKFFFVITIITLALTLLLGTVSFAATANPASNFIFNSKTGTITKYVGSAKIVIIPSKIGTKKVTALGDGAFYENSSITSVTIPNSVTSIGSHAFSDSSITSITIPNSVTSIGDHAFFNCYSITSITVPNSVTSIDYFAFTGCSELTQIIVDSKNAKFSSKDGNLFDKSRKTILCVGGGKTGDYTIPNSVTSIGELAFSRCSRITNITLPNSVTSIGDDAFSNCTSLRSITIPNSVTSIDHSLFSGCSSLTSIIIPNSVTSIGSTAFSGCSKLTQIIVDSKNAMFSSKDGNLFDKSRKTILCVGGGKIGEYTIPNSVTSIGDEAFFECSSLTSITVPNSVTSIGKLAFSRSRSLRSITIPNSVTSIGDDAFSECHSLTSITIPNSVTSIGKLAFSGCSSLTIQCSSGSYAEKYALENNIPTSKLLDY